MTGDLGRHGQWGHHGKAVVGFQRLAAFLGVKFI